MQKTVYLLLFILISIKLVTAQQLENGQKRWSATHKLTVRDFKLKPLVSKNEAAYSQFIIAHKINALDAMKRNLNQRVENLFHGRGSWIDTINNTHIQDQLRFQQLQFDLAEIQARKFRKRLFLQKGKFLSGFEIVNQISDDIMTEFTELRTTMIQETDSGRDQDAIKLWKDKITKELRVLDQFRYENKKRIKL